jgi:hypothetical protein
MKQSFNDKIISPAQKAVNQKKSIFIENFTGNQPPFFVLPLLVNTHGKYALVIGNRAYSSITSI